MKPVSVNAGREFVTKAFTRALRTILVVVTRGCSEQNTCVDLNEQMMDFKLSDTAKEYQEKILAFMDEHIYPAEPVYLEQMAESGNPNFQPPILEELKVEAKNQGLWNLFHPHKNEAWGSPGLSNLDYAPLAEIMGRSPHLAPEATNCNAPDTGNMEVLELFGTDEHKEKYLKPLINGDMASAFAMTEPAVASSDATNVQMSMKADGDDYILNGRKWFASNAVHANCKVMIVMGKTDFDAPTHRQQSMMVVPLDTPGVTVVRGLPVFGYMDREGHAGLPRLCLTKHMPPRSKVLRTTPKSPIPAHLIVGPRT